MWVHDNKGNLLRVDRINPNTVCSHCDGKRLNCPICGGIHVKNKNKVVLVNKIKGLYDDIKKRLVTIFSIR